MGLFADGFKELKKASEPRARGIADQVNELYPNVNKVATLDPPKPDDTKVPKICQ